MPEPRTSKKAKRSEFTMAADSTRGRRTYIGNPRHLAYDEKDFPIHHLSPRARKMMGFPVDREHS